MQAVVLARLAHDEGQSELAEPAADGGLSLASQLNYLDAIKRVVADHHSVSDGMAALISDCEHRSRHAAWDQLRGLDYEEAATDLRAWLLEKAPIPDRVEVVWFAMWDVTTGFDLRGSTSWSRDPEDWEWWFRDDFEAGSYEPPILIQMHDLARQADDPDAEEPQDEGVFELTDIWLSLGFVSLAAVDALRRLETPSRLGRLAELWAVSGHPDEVYGIILGGLTEAGFESGATT